MKTFGILFVAAILGYAVGLFGGMGAVNLLSSNRHDKPLEAAMTSAFVCGPMAAAIAMIVAWLVWLR